MGPKSFSICWKALDLSRISFVLLMISAYNRVVAREMVFVIPFSHADAFWVLTFEEYYRTKASYILDNIVAMMPRLPKMTFVWSDIAFLAYWWERASKASQMVLKDLVTCGRLEIVTGGWVQPDEATTSVYGLFTQLIEGHEWLYDNLQVIPETSWSLDPFGYSSTMPYLLGASGVKGGLLIQRLHFAWQRLFGRLGYSEASWIQSWDDNSTQEMKLRLQHSCTYVLTDTCGPATRLCEMYDFADRHEVQYKDIRRKSEVLLGQYGRLGSLSENNLVVVPLGGDFRFSNTSEWTRQFSNYKAIMDYVNHNEELYHAHIKFATLKEFFSEVGSPELKVQGDFFPYSDYSSTCTRKCRMKSVYWTGYYTTRPQHKQLSSTVGFKLRAVEILFTLGALSWCREEDSERPWTEEAQKKLIWARRAWSLFQHHDGITGTSTARVMKQQAKQLKRAGQYLKEILEGVISRFLSFLNACDSSSTNPTTACKVKRSNPRRSRVPQQPNKNIKCVKIVIYNTIELSRNDLSVVVVSSKIGRVEILEKGKTLCHQIVEKRSNKLVYFKTTLPPLSLTMLQLVMFDEEETNCKNSEEPPSEQSFTLSNNILCLSFVEGALVGFSSKDYMSNISIRVGIYDLYPGDNGAYVFKPCPKVTYLEPTNCTSLNKGPVFNEVRIYYDCCTLLIQILVQDENPVIYVSVEYLLQTDDKEIFLEVCTGIKSVRWMTDMNDFELKERIQAEQEGLEANVYPMTSLSYVENDEERLVVISDHSHGVANPRPGALQVMLDRRTTEDDRKGMGEPLRDNSRVTSKFLIVLYKLPDPTIDILGLSRRFTHPPLVLTVRYEEAVEEHRNSAARKQQMDQCFPRDYLLPREWDEPSAFWGLDWIDFPVIRNGYYDNFKGTTKKNPVETLNRRFESFPEITEESTGNQTEYPTTKRNHECTRETPKASSVSTTESTKRIHECTRTTKDECITEPTKQSSESTTESTKRIQECTRTTKESSEYRSTTEATRRSYDSNTRTTKDECKDECASEDTKQRYDSTIRTTMDERTTEATKRTTKESSGYTGTTEATGRSYDSSTRTTKEISEYTSTTGATGQSYDSSTRTTKEISEYASTTGATGQNYDSTTRTTKDECATEETKRNSDSCTRTSKDESTTETTKRSYDSSTRTTKDGSATEATKRMYDSSTRTTVDECAGEAAKGSSDPSPQTAKESSEYTTEATKRSSDSGTRTTKDERTAETTKRSSDSGTRTTKGEYTAETTQRSSNSGTQTTKECCECFKGIKKESCECDRLSTNQRTECQRETTTVRCERVENNESEPSGETFLLMKGCIAGGIRILTLRTRQLSGESSGWALLVLHNTANVSVTPFPDRTSFLYLELTSVVETLLTGIQEIEQYADLSDIVIPPHGLKSVKLRFKTSTTYP